MSKKQETVADIVDDMLTTARVCGDGAVRYDMFHYARRIEAAWKRERAEVRETASTTILKESVPVAVARYRRAILDFCNVYCMVYPPGDPDVPVVLQGAFQNFCDELGIEQVKLGESEVLHGK